MTEMRINIDIPTQSMASAQEAQSRILLERASLGLGFLNDAHIIGLIGDENLRSAVALVIEDARLRGRLEGIGHVIFGRAMTPTKHENPLQGSMQQEGLNG